MSNIDIIKIKEWLSSVADTYEKNKDYLTQLDSDIGDADHGINMNRGFKLVKEMINNENKESISDIFYYWPIKKKTSLNLLHFLHVIMAILCQKKLTKKYWNLSANGVV